MKEVILKPKKELGRTFSIRVEKELMLCYEELSGITGHSRNQLINNAMKNYLVDFKIDSNDEQIINKVEEFKKRYKKWDL